ncbi:MAG: patatin-like phospholipase family protein [Bryobacteraceae bacterium]
MPCALVLSAGALFGAYQAGAWNALSRWFQPDLVVGASAGSINGWAIAGGCSTADLLAMWRDPATAGLTRPRFTWVPWRGCIDPAALARHVRDLYARFKPRVPYSATMVEVPRLRLVRVLHDRITPEHLMASCAVPFGYPPVRIDGKLYVDGGVLDILPIWAAVEMGATRVIAVNALPLISSLPLRAALRVAHLVGRKPPEVSGVEVVEIRPRAPLGSVRDALVWSPENMRRWIQQGEEDASVAGRQHFPG